LTNQPIKAVCLIGSHPKNAFNIKIYANYFFLDRTASHREPDGKPDLSQMPLKSGVVQFQGKGEKPAMPPKRISTDFTLDLKKAGFRKNRSG